MINKSDCYYKNIRFKKKTKACMKYVLLHKRASTTFLRSCTT